MYLGSENLGRTMYKSDDNKNKDGNTPLHLATELGNNEMVILLILNGALVNQHNETKDTPLNVS